MIRCRASFLSALFVGLAGCATEPVREPPKVQKTPAPHLIADSVYMQISSAIESGAWTREQLEKIRNGLCLGKNPRVSIKRSFTYKPPATNGLAIDEALWWRAAHLEGARKFLKNDFFYYAGQLFNGASQPENMEQPLNADQLGEVDREAYARRNFVNGPHLLQKTYAARFLKSLYFREGGHADMQLLFRKFTFRLPLEVVTGLEEMNSTPHIKIPADNHYFGYDRGTFSPKLSLEHQDFLWRWVAKNSTSIAEAAKDNGETKFSVEMKLDFFCQYAVSVDDLRSY